MVAASAFDGIMVMAHAIKEAGTKPDKIISAIANIHNFQDAVTGPLLSFNKQGVVTRYIAVQIVKNEAFTRLAVVKDLYRGCGVKQKIDSAARCVIFSFVRQKTGPKQKLKGSSIGFIF